MAPVALPCDWNAFIPFMPVTTATPETLVSRLSQWRFWVYAALAVLLGTLLVQASHKLMTELSYGEIVDAVRATPATALGLSMLATAASYFALTFYDRTALAYAGAQLPQRVVAKTAFIAYALSNTIGLGVLTGGAVRMRLYGAAGLEAGLVSRAIVFNAFGFGIGIVVVGAGALVWGAGTRWRCCWRRGRSSGFVSGVARRCCAAWCCACRALRWRCSSC